MINFFKKIWNWIDRPITWNILFLVMVLILFFGWMLVIPNPS